MYDNNGEYINGFIERKAGGTIEGSIVIEGIDLSPITAVMFKREDEKYLWIRRKDALVYDEKTQRYNNKKREPRFEAYLKFQVNDNVVAYRGEFYFMRWKFSAVGIWDAVFGRTKGRINLFVEKLPMSKQDIINATNKKLNNE